MGRHLLIDTAGPVVGVAAWDGDVCVGEASLRQTAGADGWLTPRIAELVDALGGLDRVGVTVGPGAFTGIRVGVASALGLALARGVPVVPLSSLELRAALVPGEARVLALLDARKGKVYAGWFDTRGALPLALAEEVDLEPGDVATGPPAVLVGEGARVYADIFARLGHTLRFEADVSPVSAGKKLVDLRPAVSPDRVQIRYLRDPDARLPTV